MAKKSVKFYKSDLQPSNSTQGSLWFDTTNKVIHLNDTSGWITFDNNVSMTNLKEPGELIGKLNVGDKSYNINAPAISVQTIFPENISENLPDDNTIEIITNISSKNHILALTKNYASSINHAHANYLDKVITSDQTVKANINFEKNITATAFYEKSDKRLKNIKKPLYNTLNNIYSIPTVYFNWKDDPENNELGTIAQEVNKVYPEIVYNTQDDILAVDYSKLAIIALAAIKELNEKLEESNKKILELEKRINHGR